jgi:hypothetical protein
MPELVVLFGKKRGQKCSFSYINNNNHQFKSEVMQSRIYTYKITFEEVPYYYYGSHKEKRYNEYYMGSPVTHKWCWDFYTPKKQILEFFNTREEANFVENRLIKLFLNDPHCLNENCGGIVSLEMCKRGAKTIVENKLGIHSRTREQIIKDGNKGRETQKRLGTGVYGLSPEIRTENGKKLGQRNLQTGHIQKLGKEYGKLCYENGLGIFGISEDERKENSSKGGKISGNEAYKNKTGIHNFTKEKRLEVSSKGGKSSSSQKWKCLVTGYVSTAPGLASYQRKRNIDTSLKVKIT